MEGQSADRPGFLRLAPGIWLPNEALTWSQSRSGGPGGQHVNRTESKAELRVRPAAIQGLPPDGRMRLERLAGSRLTSDGELVLICDETRSLGRNRDLLLERLCGLVLEAAIPPRPRRPTRPGRGAIKRRLEAKSHRSELKRERRRSE